MKKKSILFIVNTLTTGGANSSLSALYAEMKWYYDIKVFALTHDGTPDAHGFKSVLLPKDRDVDAFLGDFDKASEKSRKYKLIVKILKRICIKLGINIEKFVYQKAVKNIEKDYFFDSIIAFQEKESAMLASMFRCKNKLAWIHCDFTKGFTVRDSRVYRNFKKIVFVSKYTEKQFLNRYPHYKGKTCFVYNFLDESRIERLAKEPITDMELSDTRFTILSLGRIVPLKRFSKIPHIVSEIKTKGIDLRWIILGPAFDIAEHEKLLKNIDKYNVKENVFWLGYKLNPYPYMKHSDLCVSLSTTEACPMVFNEARVLNVPIVSTDFGSADEFVTNGSDGYVCPIENIADVICNLCLNKVEYDAIHSQGGRRYINNDSIRQLLLELL